MTTRVVTLGIAPKTTFGNIKDYRSHTHNLSSCEIKASKKFRLEHQDLNT